MPAPTSPGDHQPPVTPTLGSIAEKRIFELPSYTTTGGATIRRGRVGWGSDGTLKEARDSAILGTHLFSGHWHDGTGSRRPRSRNARSRAPRARAQPRLRRRATGPARPPRRPRAARRPRRLPARRAAG